jgi:hypothetical protein
MSPLLELSLSCALGGAGVLFLTLALTYITNGIYIKVYHYSVGSKQENKER